VSKEEFEKVQAVVAEGVAREGLQDVIVPPGEAAVTGPAESGYPYDGHGPLEDEGLYYPEDEAGYRLSQLASDVAIDRMIADAQVAGVSLLEGADGLLNQITRKVLERALGAEMDDHLGYVRGDPAGSGSGNSRNGFYGKTVTTTAGPVRIQVPRDRNSEFEPVIVPKGTRRLGQAGDMILSLYSRGMTTRDIQAHLAGVYGAEVSPALISKVTDVVAEEITAWQTRPLDAFYAILYIDALMVKVRDGGAVDNKAAYLVTGAATTGTGTCSASGWPPARDRGSGPGSSPSCATAASRTSCSCAATGWPGCPRRSRRPGRTRSCRPA
jgi:hypothetical protein